MACRLVALDKRPGLRPLDIGETLCRDLAKLVTRTAGDQEKTACENLQLCAGLDAGIEGATHAVGQRILARMRENEDMRRRRHQRKQIKRKKREEYRSWRVLTILI